ncbi:GPI-specific phospholipase A2-like PGAP3 [Ciona intestinalis]
MLFHLKVLYRYAMVRLLYVICCFLILQTSKASEGDRCVQYQECLQPCQHQCKDGIFDKNQTRYMLLLGWDCREECKYTCMWKTVEAYEAANVRVPQFHGKWPFVRIIGVQELASVVFSILNGISNIWAYKQYYSAVSSNAPLHTVTTIHAIIAENAWVWSSVFHARDFPWTEKLDYFCATSLVLYSFYLSIHRLSYELHGHNVHLLRWIAGNLIGAFYLGHISYLTFQSFDYGYNMKANVAVGVMNSITWLSLCYRKRKKHPHVKKMAAAIIMTYLFLMFELSDFPPIWWTFDAHSIWHFLTIPIPLLVYSFLTDESLKMHKDFETKQKFP